MHLYKTTKGNILRHETSSFLLTEEWDGLTNQENLYQHLLYLTTTAPMISEEQAENFISNYLLPPIGSQEVWAAGVTYLRSRDARMEESKDSGAADCYQKVYEAERPELFFKALPHRVAGHCEQVYIRKDSTWNVPEAELALYINSSGKIQAYTIGNDMSSRSIEGENPLYLPQAKVYEKSAALGPCLYITENNIDQETVINMSIYRNDKLMFEESTQLSRMKRLLPELADWLFRECDFAAGCFLMTGTCMVPPNDFTLHENDTVVINIEGIGTMKNFISVKNK